MIQALFNCSQADFILVMNIILNSFSEYLSDFAVVSRKYDSTWGTTVRDKLQAAENLPNEEEREAASEELRSKLMEQAILGRKMWQFLKHYINDAYELSMAKIKLKAAGSNLYDDASNDNWPIIQMMFNMAQRFLAANEEELLAAGEMPLTFKADFDAMFKEFRKRLMAFEDGKENNMVISQQRTSALNEVHLLVMPMATLGQRIFASNEAVRKQFVFSDVLSRVGGTGLAGIRGKVTDVETSAGIEAATISMKDVEQTAVTDENGNYVLNSPSGKYQVTVTAPGYVTRVIEDFTVEVGTVSKLDVAMTKLVETPA